MRPLLLLPLLALPSLAGAQGAHRELIDKGEHPRALARLEKDLERDPADAAALYSLAHLQDLPTYGGRDVDQAYATVLRAAQAIATADARALERWARDGVNAGAVRDLRELIVAHALQQALQRNTMDACRAFLRTYAAEPSTVLDRARARLAQLAYVDARNANTVAAYEQFLRDHPGAGEGADARERIAILAFDALAGSTGSAPYRDYLARHPAGPRTAQARAERERWEFRENARPGDAQGYVDYIRNNPNSAALQEARDSLRAAGGPPEGYQFVWVPGPSGEHHYHDKLRDLTLVNVGGKRYTDQGVNSYVRLLLNGQDSLIIYNNELEDPDFLVDLSKSNNNKLTINGFDYGFSGQHLQSEKMNQSEIIIGGKWNLMKKKETIIKNIEYIYPLNDNFCVCKDGNFSIDEDISKYDEEINKYHNKIKISLGKCMLINSSGDTLIDNEHQSFSKNPVYEGSIEMYSNFNSFEKNPYLVSHDSPLFIYSHVLYGGKHSEISQLTIRASNSRLLKNFKKIPHPNYSFVYNPRNKLCLVGNNDFIGAITEDGNILIPCQYGSINPLEIPDLFQVLTEKIFMQNACGDGSPEHLNVYNIYDSKKQNLFFKNPASQIQIIENVILVGRNLYDSSPRGHTEYVGLYSTSGKELLSIIFNEISPLGDGLFALRKGTKWGLTNSKGDKLLLLEHTFDEVERKAARFR